jgi:hypothetical protein
MDNRETLTHQVAIQLSRGICSPKWCRKKWIKGRGSGREYSCADQIDRVWDSEWPLRAFASNADGRISFVQPRSLVSSRSGGDFQIACGRQPEFDRVAFTSSCMSQEVSCNLHSVVRRPQPPVTTQRRSVTWNLDSGRRCHSH